jgi:hypothetical protein
MILKIFHTLWNPVTNIILTILLFPAIINADKLTDELIRKYSIYYEKFSGVESVRVVTAVSKDPDDGKILKKFKAIISREDFFYKPPKLKALKYFENGKSGDVDEYDTREIEPFYPLFDKNSKKNYVFNKIGEKKIGSKNCLEYKVDAVKKTDRHFVGRIFVEKKTKTLVRLKGTLARKHWALKKYNFSFNYSDLKGFPVIKSGSVTARVKVFMIISDNITDYEIKVKSSKFFSL